MEKKQIEEIINIYKRMMDVNYLSSNNINKINSIANDDFFFKSILKKSTELLSKRSKINLTNINDRLLDIFDDKRIIHGVNLSIFSDELYRSYSVSRYSLSSSGYIIDRFGDYYRKGENAFDSQSFRKLSILNKEKDKTLQVSIIILEMLKETIRLKNIEVDHNLREINDKKEKGIKVSKWDLEYVKIKEFGTQKQIKSFLNSINLKVIVDFSNTEEVFKYTGSEFYQTNRWISLDEKNIFLSIKDLENMSKEIKNLFQSYDTVRYEIIESSTIEEDELDPLEIEDLTFTQLYRYKEERKKVHYGFFYFKI